MQKYGAAPPTAILAKMTVCRLFAILLAGHGDVKWYFRKSLEKAADKKWRCCCCTKSPSPFSKSI